MAYATKQDMIERFGEREITQLTDRNNTGFISDSVLASAQSDADATINGYLQDGGYTVPLSPVPYRLKRPAADVTRFYLYDDIKPDAIMGAYEKALDYLERIADGKVRLYSDSGDDISRETSRISVSSRAQVFTDDLLDTY